MATKHTISEEEAYQIARVDENGRVLGGLLPLPEPFRSIYELFNPIIIDFVTGRSQEPIAQAVSVAAKFARLPHSDKIGEIAANTFVYGLPYIDDMGRAARNIGDHFQAKKAILSNLTPLLAANKAAGQSGMIGNITGAFRTGHEGNRMIAHAFSVNTHQTYRMLGKNVMSAAPNLMNTAVSVLRDRVTDRQEKLGELQDMLALDDRGSVIAPTRAIGESIKKGAAEAKKLEEQFSQWQNVGLKLAGPLKAAVNKIGDQNHGPSIEDTSLALALGLQEKMRQSGMDSAGSSHHFMDAGDLAESVETIFKTYQEEQGYKPIPAQRLRETAQLIAEQLAHGKLHPLSLINIVGREELLNGKKNGLVGKEKIESVISKELSVLTKSGAVNVEEFLATQSFILDDVKNHVASKNEDERALVVALGLPDSVLLAAGLKREDLPKLRQRFSDRVLESMMEILITDLAKLDDEKLQEKSFSTEAVNFIREYGSEPGMLRQLLRHDGAEKEQVMGVARSALMGEDSDYWRQLIQKSSQKTSKDNTQEADRLMDQASGVVHKRALAGEDGAENLHTSRHPARTPLDHAEREAPNDGTLPPR